MRSIDTNALLRLLVEDPSDKKQSQIIRDLVVADEQLYVTQVVQLELVWVLQKAYQFPKTQIIFILELLANNAALELQRYRKYLKALNYYRDNPIGFSDCIILAEIEEKEAMPLITFDKKLGKMENTLLI